MHALDCLTGSGDPIASIDKVLAHADEYLTDNTARIILKWLQAREIVSTAFP